MVLWKYRRRLSLVEWGGNFYIGDSDEQEALATFEVPATKEPTTTNETAVPPKSSSDKDDTNLRQRTMSSRRATKSLRMQLRAPQMLEKKSGAEAQHRTLQMPLIVVLL